MSKHTTRAMVRSASLASLSALVLSLALGACTEAKLEPVPPEPTFRDDKLNVTGHICTNPPETLTFPLRVMFIVDSSISMEVSDPPDPVTGFTGRERAVTDTWTELLDEGPQGVRFGIIRFSSQAQSRTGTDLDSDGLPDTYFTADRILLETATQALAVTDRTTNYGNALSEAYYEIRTELMDADLESLPLSKYVVIFLSDGLPDTDDEDSRGNAEGEILEAVDALQTLAHTFRVGDFTFHTAYISAGLGDVFDQQAKDLLKAMADQGGGNFRSFPSGEELNFLFVDFNVLKRVFTLKTLVAVNQNTVMDTDQVPNITHVDARAGGAVLGDLGAVVGAGTFPVVDPNAEVDLEAVANQPTATFNQFSFVDLNGNGRVECGEPMVDSDGDGLSDITEVATGSNPLVRDTDDDGLGDRMEWELQDSGLDPIVVNESCIVANPCVDEDNNGLCDCLLDLDLDGVCDCVVDPELTCVDPALGLDCEDENFDGNCDCLDADGDGRCDYADTDGDGLHDCEEVIYGSAQNGNDTDADGLPDVVEVSFKTNPTTADDAEDLDFDLTINGVEVRSNTDPLCDDARLRSRAAFRYQIDDLGLVGTTSCYDFDISNITLVPTLNNYDSTHLGYPGNGVNRIYFYAGEVAFDDPGAFAIYRIACVEAAYNPVGGYKSPPSGHIELSEEDFIEAVDFDPEIHCK